MESVQARQRAHLRHRRLARIRGHPRPSEACTDQRPSEAIRGHPRPSEAIRGHPRSSEAIRGGPERARAQRALGPSGSSQRA
jgi:hypothetical protein